jgi:hypothetical protein
MGGTAHTSYWANMMDLSPRHCGVLLGVSNTIATIPGILANMWAGWAVERGSWELVWGSVVFVNIVGFGCFRAWCKGEVIWR